VTDGGSITDEPGDLGMGEVEGPNMPVGECPVCGITRV
jgi:hypothetical protein